MPVASVFEPVLFAVCGLGVVAVLLAIVTAGKAPLEVESEVRRQIEQLTTLSES